MARKSLVLPGTKGTNKCIDGFFIIYYRTTLSQFKKLTKPSSMLLSATVLVDPLWSTERHSIWPLSSIRKMIQLEVFYIILGAQEREAYNNYWKQVCLYWGTTDMSSWKESQKKNMGKLDVHDPDGSVVGNIAIYKRRVCSSADWNRHNLLPNGHFSIWVWLLART